MEPPFEPHNPVDWYVWVYAGVTVCLAIMVLIVLLQLRTLRANQDRQWVITNQIRDRQEQTDQSFRQTIRQLEQHKEART